MHVIVDGRYNGPPGSGHGGYSAGLAALALGEAAAGRAVEVTLRRPPPLDTPLAVAAAEDGVELRDGAEPVMTARPAELALEPPGPAPGAAGDPEGWAADHPFPTCFGCGPLRDPADALCLYPGPVGDGRWAVPWTPAEWATGPEFVWAALDCPSSGPADVTASAPIVLGRFTVAIAGRVSAGEPLSIVSWLEHVDGRKRFTGVALYRGDAVLARGRAVWIALA